ncbi:glutaredoxin family protein [Pelotomaculum propionicicum]|uniref:glutaredoxin family protein n=1 Tax=Pelotomaculum propionicicum TaxID=258475 RepID=UPI003B802D4C
MVKLYALSTCPWCKKAKQFFTQKQIPYEFIEVDLLEEKEQDKTLQELRYLSGDALFPLTIIGEEVILGYKPDDFEEALKNDK